MDVRTFKLYSLLVAGGWLAMELTARIGPSLAREIVADCRWLLLLLDITGIALLISILYCGTGQDTFFPPRRNLIVLASALTCPWLMAWFAAYICWAFAMGCVWLGRCLVEQCYKNRTES